MPAWPLNHRSAQTHEPSYALRKCWSDDKSCDLMLTKSATTLAKYQRSLFLFVERDNSKNCEHFAANMQNVINSVKGTALGVAEFLTPVLKVNQ